MSIAMIYWTGTGNTEEIANAIAEGIKSNGGELDIFKVGDITPEEAIKYDKLLLGCPAMGAEVLEEVEFEPFYTDLEGSLGGKKVGLFGSYSWADGQWMEEWVERANDKGALVFRNDGLIIFEAPDAAGVEECKLYGKEFIDF